MRTYGFQVHYRFPGWDHDLAIRAAATFEDAMLEAVRTVARTRADVWIFRVHGAYVATCNALQVYFFGRDPDVQVVDVVDAS